MAKATHNDGKLKKLWPYLAALHTSEPDAFKDGDTLRIRVARAWKALLDPAYCPNCGESMTTYIRKFDFINALLLKQMGDIVKERLAQGMSLAEANQVHVVSANVHDSVRHSTSIARTLGLIAKVKTAEGKHDTKKGWLITSRGFAALRN